MFRKEANAGKPPTGREDLVAKVHGGSGQGVRAHNWNPGLLSYDILFCPGPV